MLLEIYDVSDGFNLHAKPLHFTFELNRNAKKQQQQQNNGILYKQNEIRMNQVKEGGLLVTFR